MWDCTIFELHAACPLVLLVLLLLAATTKTDVTITGASILITATRTRNEVHRHHQHVCEFRHASADTFTLTGWSALMLACSA